MLLKKTYQLVIIMALMTFLAVFSCENANKNAEVIEEPAEETVKTQVDSSQSKEEFMLKTGVEDLRESRTEIDKQLEDFLALINKKEKALLDRENATAKLELELGLKADELEKKEASLRYQQYLAWFVFLVGLIALIAGIIIARKKKVVPDAEEASTTSQEEKNEYLDKMAKQVGEWEANIEALKKKAEKAKTETKNEYLAQIEALNQKKEAAQKKLAELQAAGDDMWEDLKSVVESAWEDMKKSLKSASNKIK